MRTLHIATLAVLALILGAAPAWSQGVKFVTTGTAGSQHGSDVPAESDPLGSKPVNPQWDAGHPNTQQPYDENCTEDRCIRAEKRQLGNTTWQEDRASGLHQSGKSAESRPSK